MESIIVTPETMAQYRKDCRADRLREKGIEDKPQKRVSEHDRFMLGKTVFVPKQLLNYRFSREELHAIAL